MSQFLTGWPDSEDGTKMATWRNSDPAFRAAAISVVQQLSFVGVHGLVLHLTAFTLS